jgi:acyl carrier protein
MRTDEILARLQVVFDGVFLDEVAVTPGLTAADVPEWDSLLHVSLILAIEREFKIRFRIGEVEALQNVGELAALIAKRAGGA